MNKGYFITGIGTEVGKTLVTSALCHQALELGYSARAIKPIITGYEKNTENDISTLISAQNTTISGQDPNKVSIYRYKNAISPDIAAIREQKSIDYSKILDFCAKKLKNNVDYTFFEGVGGIMVPLTAEKTLLDLIKDLDLEIILVSATYLGSINHTLISLETLKHHGVNISTIVLSESMDSPVSLAEVTHSLKNHTDVEVFCLPRIESAKKKWQNVPQLFEFIIRSSNYVEQNRKSA